MVKLLSQKVKDLSLDLIDQPREVLRLDIDPDAVDLLAQSISEIGLLQPIMVAIHGNRYEIVFGHRRYLACQKLGLSTIRAIVRTMDKKEVGIARATENIARADLTPIEEASTYCNLMEGYGLTLEQIAKKMGKTPATIKRRMDLLRMPPQLQQAVHKKQISMTVAEELWSIRDMTSLDYYLTFAIENGCTREVARSWAKEWRDAERRSKTANVDGGHHLAPTEPRPVYVSCDLCAGPMELGQETVLRLCPECFNIVKQAK